MLLLAHVLYYICTLFYMYYTHVALFYHSALYDAICIMPKDCNAQVHVSTFEYILILLGIRTCVFAAFLDAV